MNQPQTMIDKLWAAHEIVRREDGQSLLWVDRHYVHEGSFHAFGKLAERGVKVAEPGLTFGVADHYVPTRGSRQQHRQSRAGADGAPGRGEHRASTASSCSAWTIRGRASCMWSAPSRA